MPHEWFDIHRIDEATFVIDEPMHVRSHLILGAERAVLFDSGLGVMPIRPVVEALTDLPVLVVNSHHHFDHVGGNHEFEEIAIHREGSELLAAGPAEGWLTAYWKGITDWMASLDAAGAGRGPRPLPATFDPSDPRVVPTVATRLLEGGEVLALGGRDLLVLHTPGHTRDSICLLDADAGMLFGGDTIDSGAIYTHLPTADLSAFIGSAEHLDRTLPDSVRAVLSPHGPNGREPRSLVGDLARALALAAQPDAGFEPGTDCLLQDAAVFRDGDLWIYRPADLLTGGGPSLPGRQG